MDDAEIYPAELGVEMKIDKKEPPREFKVGHHGEITLKDCAHIYLESDEQVTFKTKSGTEYDVARKSWGYYATPSLNGRLPSFNLKPVLVKSEVTGKFNVFLVEFGKEEEFQEYIDKNGHQLVAWLDNDKSLKALEKAGEKAGE